MGIVERCLACEADSGRHRSAVTFRQPPVKVVISKAYDYALPFLSAPDVAKHVKRGSQPVGLASEAALHESTDEQELVLYRANHGRPARYLELDRSVRRSSG
jgi:hypothetical protein